MHSLHTRDTLPLNVIVQARASFFMHLAAALADISTEKVIFSNPRACDRGSLVCMRRVLQDNAALTPIGVYNFACLFGCRRHSRATSA